MHFFDETFFVGLAVIIFVGLIYKPIKRVLVRFLDERTIRIKRDLDEALRLKEEAQELLASYQRKQKEAAEEAVKIISFAEEEVKRMTEEAEEKLEEALNKRIELTMQKLANYENAVLQEVRNNSVDIAVSAVHSLVLEHLNHDLAEELITKAVGQLDRKLN